MPPTPTSDLADIFPLISSWRIPSDESQAEAHGSNMHDAINILENDTRATPAERDAVIDKALDRALTVLASVPDGLRGIFADGCRRLLALHPAPAAHRARFAEIEAGRGQTPGAASL